MADPPYGGFPKRDWSDLEQTVGIPETGVLWTLDQLRRMLGLGPKQLMAKCHRRGVDYGKSPVGKLELVNIGSDDRPEWRCHEKEFARWLKSKKIATYQSSW